MVEELQCWRCGASLGRVLLPMSRREECPSCETDQHVCKLCRFYQPDIAGACREERAETVSDKERANFCDYFEPRPDAYEKVPVTDPRDTQADARAGLAALFGDEPPPTSAGGRTAPGSSDEAMDELRKLFGDDE